MPVSFRSLLSSAAACLLAAAWSTQLSAQTSDPQLLEREIL
jgi:hypothetical protein